MGRLSREYAWDRTPLGPRSGWPQSLKTAVRILLTSRFAMWMGWGRDLTFLYNDAYAPTLGVKHPWALGQPANQVWAEIWRDIGPRIETVMRSGEATWDEGLLLFLERSGYPEETYHTFSYSPLTDDDGEMAGMLCVVTEETERIIGTRRLGTLRVLASELATASSEHQVMSAVAHALGANDKDFPFALVYLLDGSKNRVRLSSTTGVTPGHHIAPNEIPLDSSDAPWPVELALARGAPVVVDMPDSDDPSDLPRGAWDVAPRRAVLVPIAQRGQIDSAGVLIAALNPYRAFDQAYADFIDLVSGQISASLASARSYEEERRRAESLAELDRAKTAFFSNVSHEFRTPLTLLLAPLEDAIRSGASLGSNVRDELDLAHRNALRLLKLVNTLLDFSRIEAGRVEARYEPTDLGAYTAELASSFRSACERAGLELRIETSPNEPKVFVDRDMWEKVVLNLISNAFKHTFDGEILVTVHSTEHAATLEVRDTGVGIAADQLPRLFDRFHRVPNALSRTHEGTGIGLALVQELVRRHGGTITVESSEGMGSIFAVTLPAGSDHLPQDRVVNKSNTGEHRAISTRAAPFVQEALRWLPNDSDNGSGLSESTQSPLLESTGETPNEGVTTTGRARILLADDNSDMREYVARLLRNRGWDVEAVSDGAVALESALRAPPDLVLSDVMMPGLDGFALLRALRANDATRTIPTILLSARAGEEARVEGVEAGADDYLVKPFAAQELVARVATHLSLAQSRRASIMAVAEARDLLRRVLEQAPVAIVVFRGPEHVIEMANEAQIRLMGKRNAVGKPVMEAFPELQGQWLVPLLDEVYRTGTPRVIFAQPIQYDRDLNGKSETRYFSVSYYPFRESDGSISRIICAGSDVTNEESARREMEAAQREAEDARRIAEAANRAKSQFLAVMSHELRTPLNAIAGHVQLMELGIHGPVTPAQESALDRINRSQRHLLRLINDVLNLSRIESGGVDYAIRDVAVHEVAQSLMPMIEPQLHAKSLELQLSMPSEPVHVRADRDLLGQILLNLLSNAVKFTAAGGRVSVNLATRAAVPEWIFVRVSDTGIGIAREKQNAIFEPFVQVNTTHTRNSEGAGLGLSISRDLARGMGGDLRVRSELGVGSVFTVSLRRSEEGR